MSEQTPKLQLTHEQNEQRKLVVHFPKFMQAEGRAMLVGHEGAAIVERGSYIAIGVGEHVRIGDCVVKCTGLAADGNIHVDLYAESQARG